MKLNLCGKCKEYKDYPLFKCPLGPPSFEPNEKATSYGLNYKNGIAEYARLCLGCAKAWINTLSEDYLRDGTITEVEIESDSPAVSKAQKVEAIQEGNPGCLSMLNPLSWFRRR